LSSSVSLLTALLSKILPTELHVRRPIPFILAKPLLLKPRRKLTTEFHDGKALIQYRITTIGWKTWLKHTVALKSCRESLDIRIPFTSVINVHRGNTHQKKCDTAKNVASVIR
jgi:hypothetical protein